MLHSRTLDAETGRSDRGGVEIGRRHYLTAVAAVGSSAVAPSVAAQEGGTDGAELFRATVDDGGATAAVSETGDVVAFGLYEGIVRAYRSEGDGAEAYDEVEFVLPNLSAGFPVSHVLLDEATNAIVAAAMDDDAFGGGNLGAAGGGSGSSDSEVQWSSELPGLWDIDGSADLSTVAAVSAPLQGTPQVALVRDGELAWERPLDDAAAMSVAVSDDGAHVVVGCVHLEDGIERTGRPGIRVYSDDGEHRWSHDTDEDVTGVGVDVENDIVVAGVDFGSTLAFDLEGTERWQRDDAPTMTALSGDGSTVVATPPVTGLDAGDGSVLWESDVQNANVLADPTTVSEDGSRVAVSTLDFELLVLDDGDRIWEGENDTGPYYSAISADGSTLAAMEVDNDAQTADLVGYRP